MGTRGHTMGWYLRSVAVPISARGETPPRPAPPSFAASDRTNIVSFPYRSAIDRDFLATRKRPRVGTVARSRAGLRPSSRRFRGPEYRYGERAVMERTRP